MNLEKFIEETLVGIRNGVTKANSRITADGGSSSKHFSITKVGSDNTLITFDVAVTVSGENNKEAGAGIRVLDVGFGGSTAKLEKNEQVSRIKFSVSPAITIQ